jgi:hypothetical protein
MQIETRRFLELAVHVKLVSEAMLAAAENMAQLRPRPADSGYAAWGRTMDELIAMNVQVGFMERILRAAACDDVTAPCPATSSAPVMP